MKNHRKTDKKESPYMGATCNTIDYGIMLLVVGSVLVRFSKKKY